MKWKRVSASGKGDRCAEIPFDSRRIRLLFVRSGPEAELKRCSDIGLGACGEQRNQPALVLDIPRETKARSGEDVCVDRDIILVPALGRDEHGNILRNAPLLEGIAEDPILRDVKIIARLGKQAAPIKWEAFPRGVQQTGMAVFATMCVASGSATQTWRIRERVDELVEEATTLSALRQQRATSAVGPQNRWSWDARMKSFVLFTSAK